MTWEKWDFTGIESPGLPQACEPESCTTTTASGKVVSANLCEPLSGDKLGVCKEVRRTGYICEVQGRGEFLHKVWGYITIIISKCVQGEYKPARYHIYGQSCSYSPNRKFSITYSFHCDDKATATTYVLPRLIIRSYTLHIYSQKACPDLAAKALSPFVILLLILVGLLLCIVWQGYCTISSTRTSGVESIPNIDFWRNF